MQSVQEKDKLLAINGDSSQHLTRELIISCIKLNNPASKNLFGFSDQEDWERGIEQLLANHMNIRKIDNLAQFTSIRKLQLIDNFIVRIEGLEGCCLLEELSLENNKIERIEGISHLKYLKKLDIGRNRIKKIEGLKKLDHLA